MTSTLWVSTRTLAQGRRDFMKSGFMGLGVKGFDDLG